MVLASNRSTTVFREIDLTIGTIFIIPLDDRTSARNTKNKSMSAHTNGSQTHESHAECCKIPQNTQTKHPIHAHETR